MDWGKLEGPVGRHWFGAQILLTASLNQLYCEQLRSYPLATAQYHRHTASSLSVLHCRQFAIDVREGSSRQPGGSRPETATRGLQESKGTQGLRGSAARFPAASDSSFLGIATAQTGGLWSPQSRRDPGETLHVFLQRWKAASWRLLLSTTEFSGVHSYVGTQGKCCTFFCGTQNQLPEDCHRDSNTGAFQF